MASDRLDINTATVDDFEQLIGIGRHKAAAIVKHRKKIGLFRIVSDLVDIPGIGQSVIDLNRVHLCCKTSKSPSRSLRSRHDSEASSSTAKSVTVRASRHASQSKVEFKCRKYVTLCGTKKSKSVSGFKKPQLVKNRENEITPSTRDVKKSVSISEHVDLPSTSRNLSPIQNFAKYPTPRQVGFCSNEEEEEEEVNEVASNSGEANGYHDGADEEFDKIHHFVDEGQYEVRADDISGSFCSLPSGQRSRIPIPVANSFEKQMTKRKNSRENHHIPIRKRLCCQDFSSPQTTYGNLKAPLKRSLQYQRQRIPSKEHPPPGLVEWLIQFQNWDNAERLMAVDELIMLCEPTQVRHMMQVIEPQFQRDFISLLPKELALYVLSFLEPKDLLQAAQTCRYWRVLTEDNLLWREKCKEENIDEQSVFGTNRLRRRQPSPKSPWKFLYMRQHQIEQNWRSGPLRPPKLLKGHDDHVITCLEFCGTRVVSGSDDNTLKVWSAINGKCLRTLVGHTGGVWSSQMQGNIIISGSTDRTLKVWNADSGACMYTLYGHTSTVRCMHLCGNIVVSGSRDATLRVWNVETGLCLHVLMGHVAAVRCVQYDGRRVVSGAYDYMVKVWDPDSETCLHTLQGHTNRVYSLQFDGVHIVSGSLDTSIRVWDVESGNCLHTLVGHQSLTSGLELKDNILVSGNADSTVKVWDITTGQCLQTLQGSNKHQSAVTCLQFNKKFVITSSDDGTVKIWDLKTGDFLRNLVTLESGGSGGVVWRVRCNNTKLVCAVGSRNGTEETKLLVLDFDVEEKRDKMSCIEKA